MTNWISLDVRKTDEMNCLHIANAMAFCVIWTALRVAYLFSQPMAKMCNFLLSNLSKIEKNCKNPRRICAFPASRWITNYSGETFHLKLICAVLICNCLLTTVVRLFVDDWCRITSIWCAALRFHWLYTNMNTIPSPCVSLCVFLYCFPIEPSDHLNINFISYYLHWHSVW